MTVNETLGGLGSWAVQLRDETPDEVLSQLGFLGHIVIVRGRVDVTATSASLLAAARYVGVLRERSKDRRTLEGDGMLFWLGDEDDKGKVLEAAVNLSAASVSTAVNAVLPPAVHAGTINTAAGTYTGKHQYETPRSALDTITAAFSVEYRVNGTGTIDVGTQAQLYRTTPTTIIAAKNSGADMDLTSLGASFDVDESARDYSTRVLLLGSSFDDGTTTVFATGSANAPTVPYVDLWGNAVQLTRMISESGTTTGSVTARAQLQLNRFNRQATALKVTATDYEISGPFTVGDNAYVYDPANGIQDAARSIDFRGELIHPDVVRISGATWPVTEDHTVAFRTNAGAWVDLTPWVMWETGGGEITVGDLPKSLTSGGSNPVIDRADSLPDATIPTAPTGLSLTTFAEVDPKGQNRAYIRASWTAPTVNTDGTVITDLASYLVRWRVLGRPAWQSTTIGVTQIDLPVTIDTDFEVQVAAADRSGHVSAYTASVTIHASVDTAAPGVPQDPAVTSYLGQLRIAWSGLTSVGGAMPNDFNRVDVHVSATTGFTPSTSTLVSSLSTAGVAYATAPYGATRYVKLIAYDNAGNASAPSGQVSGATTQVADGDVAALSVGKLTAGTMSADVVVGGRFATALTGARVEMNSLGFQKYDASSNLLVSITGTEALLTGIFKTALTGRRIEIGAAGATGEMDFLAPDGTKTFIRARTESAGIEAIQFGIAGAGGDPSLPNSLWNRINYNNDSAGGGGVGYASYRANKHEFIYGKTSGFWHVLESANDVGGTTLDRFYIDQTHVVFHSDSFEVWKDSGGKRLGIDTSLAYWDQGGQLRMYINDPDFTVYDGSANSRLRIQDSLADTGDVWFQWPTVAGRALFRGSWISGTDGISARLQLVNDYNFGAVIRFFSNSSGANSRFDFTNVLESGYVPLTASAFNVSSSQETKRDIADFGGDALAAIRAAKVRMYRRLGSESTEGEASPDGPEEIGLIAEEAPSQIVVPALDGTSAIDLYQYVALLHRAVQQLAAGRGTP